MTLEEVIRKIERWRDNLLDNAAHYQNEGSTESAIRADVRAADMNDILAMLREVK